MFSKAKPKGEAERSPASAGAAAVPKTSGVPSIISPDLAITGDLNSHGDVQIDGHVEGDVAADTLTIGEHGTVRGSIKADKVRVCGKVLGQIEGTAVTLAASARVEGDVLHERLEIEPGAHLEGHCRRTNRAASVPKGSAGKGERAAKEPEVEAQPVRANGAASGSTDAEAKSAH